MPWFDIFILLGLILLNGFFAMSELAVVSARRARLVNMVSDGVPGAQRALKLSEEPTTFLSTVQIGITMVAIVSGAYGEGAFAVPLATLIEDMPVVGPWASVVSSAIVVVSIAYVSLIIGELVPKRVALNNPERLACIVAGPMAYLSLAATPFVLLLRKSTDFVLKLIGVAATADATVTEEEVKTMIAEGTEAGVFEQSEREIIEGVLRVADLSVRSVMVPRPDVIWLDITDDIEETLRTVAQSGHSRFPVASEDVDQIIGIIHAKSLLEQYYGSGQIDLKAAAEDPLYVHESTKVLRLLDLFKSSTTHIAIVLDEHGTVQGIVTPTDILTAIAGDLPEMADQASPSSVQREDGSWLLDAQLPIFEVERILDVRGLGVDDAEYTTLAGFVLSQLGHIPKEGEAVRWRDWYFEVVDMDGRRVDKILARTAQGG
jgi:putative hemolysin